MKNSAAKVWLTLYSEQPAEQSCWWITQARYHLKSQPACSCGGPRWTHPPASLTHWDSVPPSIFPLKTYHDCTKSLEFISGHESTFSPDCWLFWLKHLSFLFTLASWLLSQEQLRPEFSSNKETRPLVTCIVIGVLDGFWKGTDLFLKFKVRIECKFWCRSSGVGPDSAFLTISRACCWWHLDSRWEQQAVYQTWCCFSAPLTQEGHRGEGWSVSPRENSCSFLVILPLLISLSSE